jgi:putative ABC transport system ATP-binding protein
MVTHDPAAAKYAARTLHLDKGHFVEKDLGAPKSSIKSAVFQ